jgi:alpha-aminoadipic semialdehyde synthase
MAVDILPTALSREASVHFSDVLTPYLRAVLRSYRGDTDADQEHEVYVQALERATIASGGALRENHRWLEAPLGIWRARSGGTEPDVAKTAQKPVGGPPRRKKVLMLGSGMVAAPAIDEIARHSDIELVVG